MGLFSNNDKMLLKMLQSIMGKSTYPGTQAPLLSLMSLNRAIVKKKTLQIDVEIQIPCLHQTDMLTDYFSSFFDEVTTFDTIDLTLSTNIKTINTSDKIPNIKQIILVASGKGGVGKSTTSANLALALSYGGAKVGLLDADIYGPSLPTMLGVSDQKPISHDGKLLEPVKAHGLYTMSLGFLVKESDATVWRGPMASRALGQLIFETNWPKIDYLIVDMPPGTGDIQLTMSSDIPVSGAIVVTTPQNLALKDAQKGISMFNQVKVPVIGVIENMSFHECDSCGHHSNIFGEKGGEDLASNNSVPLLGHLPLNADIGADIDKGIPTMIKTPNSTASLAYLAIAQQCAINLNKTNLSIPSFVIGE